MAPPSPILVAALLAALLVPRSASAEASRGVPVEEEGIVFARGLLDLDLGSDYRAWAIEGGVQFSPVFYGSLEYSNVTPKDDGISRGFGWKLRLGMHTPQPEGEGLQLGGLMAVSENVAEVASPEGAEHYYMRRQSANFTWAATGSYSFGERDGFRIAPYFMPQYSGSLYSYDLVNRENSSSESELSDSWFAVAAGVSAWYVFAFASVELYYAFRDGSTPIVTFALGGSI